MDMLAEDRGSTILHEVKTTQTTSWVTTVVDCSSKDGRSDMLPLGGSPVIGQCVGSLFTGKGA
eukprot:9729305-Prorocentrum_lima.AAC.1